MAGNRGTLLYRLSKTRSKIYQKQRPELEAPAVCHIYMQLFNNCLLRNQKFEELGSVGRRNTVSRNSGAIGGPWAEQVG